jgi:26S proteasome regulatory subunit N9
MHPILGALDGTPHEWIKKLLFTFNEGSIGRFEALAPLFPREVRGDRSRIGDDAS